MTGLQPKTPAESRVETRYLVMPHEANPYGTAFGGVIMSWIDMTAGMAAQRHCRMEAVTAGIDSIVFKKPISIGDHVIIKASVNYVSRTSMEVGVRVIREHPYTGEKAVATKAYLTFVALNENKEPVEITPVQPETENEKRRYNNAKLRVKARKELLKKMQK